MKKIELLKIIKESIKELINEQGAPFSKRRRVYGCKCDEMMSSNIEAGLGIVVTNAEEQAYNAQHSPMPDPFGGGMTPAIYHHYGSGTIASRDIGGGKKLICPRNMFYEISHATVDCEVPQERQIFWQNVTAGHNTVKIAINGVMQESGGGAVQSFQSATCGGSGVYPHPCLGTGPDEFEDEEMMTKAPDNPLMGPMDKITPSDIELEPSDREPMDDAGIQRMKDLAFRRKR